MVGGLSKYINVSKQFLFYMYHKEYFRIINVTKVLKVVLKRLGNCWSYLPPFTLKLMSVIL